MATKNEVIKLMKEKLEETRNRLMHGPIAEPAEIKEYQDSVLKAIEDAVAPMGIKIDRNHFLLCSLRNSSGVNFLQMHHEHEREVRKTRELEIKELERKFDSIRTSLVLEGLNEETQALIKGFIDTCNG